MKDYTQPGKFTALPPGPDELQDHFAMGYLPDGRVVSMGEGWQWLVGGARLFGKAPGVWLLMTLCIVIFAIATSLIPLIGVLLQLLIIIFYSGLLVGCRQLEIGEKLRFSHLFSAFAGSGLKLVCMQIVLTVALIFILIDSAFMLGMLYVVTLELDFPLGSPGWLFDQPEEGWTGSELFNEGDHPVLLAIMAVLLILILPVMWAILLLGSMSTWLALQLVVFHQRGIFSSLWASFVAVLVNWLPFLLYGIVMLIAWVIAAIPMFLGFPPFLVIGTEAYSAAHLGLLVFIPIMVTSTYVAYRRIFFSETAGYILQSQ